MTHTFTPGTRVEVLLTGVWTGPFEATAHTGRTPDHLVLRTPAGTCFEVYNDAPFNIRPLVDPDEYCPSCEQDTRRGHYDTCPTR